MTHRRKRGPRNRVSDVDWDSDVGEEMPVIHVIDHPPSPWPQEAPPDRVTIIPPAPGVPNIAQNSIVTPIGWAARWRTRARRIWRSFFDG